MADYQGSPTREAAEVAEAARRAAAEREIQQQGSTVGEAMATPPSAQFTHGPN